MNLIRNQHAAAAPKPLRKGGLLGLLCLSLSLAGPFPAYPAPKVELGTAAGAAGSTVLLPIALRGAANAVALQLDLRFDSTNLVGEAPALPAALNRFTLASNQVRPGVHRLILYSRSGTSLPD